ncbi:MAG: transposase [Pacificimonas sp.]|nr:transposase [Pacificimonas sp.]
MPNYRRMWVPGGTFAFTVCLKARGDRTLVEHIGALRHAWRETELARPFETLAVCVLPDHLHAVWKLPEGAADYPGRWRSLKRRFTNAIGHAVWQKRYWEHTVRDQNELGDCIDYVHGNPVKHGLVAERDGWPYSSWHRFRRENGLQVDGASRPSSISGCRPPYAFRSARVHRPAL